MIAVDTNILVYEFFSIVTLPRSYAPASTPAQAVDQLEAWLESPRVVLWAEPDEHWSDLRGVLEDSRVVGPMVHDARIAALCVAHGVAALWTADRDFSRFANLPTVNPLV